MVKYMKKFFLSLIAFTICVGAYATYNVSELTLQLTKDEAGITVTPSNMIRGIGTL